MFEGMPPTAGTINHYYGTITDRNEAAKSHITLSIMHNFPFVKQLFIMTDKMNSWLFVQMSHAHNISLTEKNYLTNEPSNSDYISEQPLARVLKQKNSPGVG